MSSLPGQGTEVTYNTEDITAGKNNVINDRPAVSDTYKRGQILGRVTASGKYTLYVTGGSGGEEIAKAICAQDITLSSDGTIPVIYGDFQKAGVEAVMAGLSVPVTVTDLMIAELDDVGIYLKNV